MRKICPPPTLVDRREGKTEKWYKKVWKGEEKCKRDGRGGGGKGRGRGGGRGEERDRTVSPAPGYVCAKPSGAHTLTHTHTVRKLGRSLNITNNWEEKKSMLIIGTVIFSSFFISDSYCTSAHTPYGEIPFSGSPPIPPTLHVFNCTH